MKLKIRENPGEIQKRIKTLHKLKKTAVHIGLPPSAGGRLRLILAVQEHGSPLLRIPPRPVIVPALAKEETREVMAEHMNEAVHAAWEGNEVSAKAALNEAGKAGADGIRAYIDSHIPPPNSKVTVSGGWIYNRIAKKAVHVPGKGFDKPLYDTGELYNAFTYEISEDDNNK